MERAILMENARVFRAGREIFVRMISMNVSRIHVQIKELVIIHPVRIFALVHHQSRIRLVKIINAPIHHV